MGLIAYWEILLNLGGKKISGLLGDHTLKFLHYSNPGTGGQSDLIAYFIRRIADIVRLKSYFSIISTNTVSEGDTREGSLQRIIANGKFEIIFAIKSIRWPGIANLFVALFSIYKGNFKKPRTLNNDKVASINAYFLNEENYTPPHSLLINHEKLFRGVDFGGTGYIITEEQKKHFLKCNEHNNEVIMPLVNGDEINNDPLQLHNRYIINFWNFTKEKAATYVEPFDHVQKYVKPYRDRQKDKAAKERWWIYKRNKIDLYRKLENLDKCLVTAFTAKYLFYSLVPTNKIYSNALNIMAGCEFERFAILQSTLHFEWARKYGSKLKNDLRYTPTDCFETFPFPNQITVDQLKKLATIGKLYHEDRKQLMAGIQLGLTKTFNLLNDSNIKDNERTKFGKKLPKNLQLLVNHLEKTPDTLSYEEALLGIIKLRKLHEEMDKTVLDAYGWSDINLKHDFSEVDYLPENDRTRFTFHPDARKEILKRLLGLNHKIHEEEVKAGLWDKKSGSKSTKKSKTKTNQVNEGEVGYGGLFG